MLASAFIPDGGLARKPCLPQVSVHPKQRPTYAMVSFWYFISSLSPFLVLTDLPSTCGSRCILFVKLAASSEETVICELEKRSRP
jgi:hypothetical protein